MDFPAAARVHNPPASPGSNAHQRSLRCGRASIGKKQFELKQPLWYRKGPVTGRRLPENVHLFILNHVESLDALEVLLLLWRSGNALELGEIAERLRLNPTAVKRRLDYFQSVGLAVSGGDPPRWKVASSSPSLQKDLHDLATHCDRDRFSVVNLIATRNLERMKSLADSFRFRGKS